MPARWKEGSMLSRLTVANLVDRAYRKFGEKIFAIREHPVIYRNLGAGNTGNTLSFKDAYQSANAVAGAMRDKLGVKKGDRVALALTNVPEMGMFFTACARIGAMTVPFNYMLKAEELTGCVSDCGAKVLITEPELYNMNIAQKERLPQIEHWIMTGKQEDVPEGFWSIDELTDGYTDVEIAPAEINPDEPIAIFYTSGTTGFPKGAMLTSRNLLSTVTLSARMLRLGKKDFGVMALPLAHIFGFTTGIVGGFYSGASGYLMRFFDPEKVLRMIEKYRATIFLGVPAMYNMLLQCNPEKYDLSSMRYWFSGADAMPVEQIKAIESLGGKFIEGYGLVETSPIISVNPYFLRRPGSVGIPVPGVKVRVMGEDGRFKKRGEVGEFVIRGPNVMKGYWGDEERTREAFKGGWFHTGDIGYRDRLGFLYFVDREKDVVKAGGYSVFSREVEEEILAHPKIFEVAVVGRTHPTKGEVPVAFVQLKEGEEAKPEEILEWCRKRIAAYKAPREIRIVDELPLTMTMKVLKRDLRKQLEKEYAEGS